MLMNPSPVATVLLNQSPKAAIRGFSGLYMELLTCIHVSMMHVHRSLRKEEHVSQAAIHAFSLVQVRIIAISKE